MPAPLVQLCGHGHQQPSVASLQHTLRQIIDGFEHTYICIDALDECAEREQLLTWLGDILRQKTGKIHILLSSRWEQDIEDSLESIANIVRVPLTGASVNADIANYLEATLSRMTKWDAPLRVRVKEVLTIGANGM